MRPSRKTNDWRGKSGDAQLQDPTPKLVSIQVGGWLRLAERIAVEERGQMGFSDKLTGDIEE